MCRVVVCIVHVCVCIVCSHVYYVYDYAYTNATGADMIYMSRPLHVCAIYKLSVESKGGCYPSAVIYESYIHLLFTYIYLICNCVYLIVAI